MVHFGAPADWGPGMPTPDVTPLTIAHLSEHPDAAPLPAAWFAREWGHGTPALTQAASAERPAAQTGRGFCRAMIAAAEATAATAGLAPLYLYSPAKVAFYRHLGWEPVGETIVGDKQATVLRHACRRSGST